MQVTEVNGDDVVCLIKNSATLSGTLYTLHVSQIRIDLPSLTDKDKEVSCSLWSRHSLTQEISYDCFLFT
jgi:pyruvate kinase